MLSLSTVPAIIRRLSSHSDRPASSSIPQIRGRIGPCMDVEKSIADIAFLEELYALPDERPVLTSGGRAASPNHDEFNGGDFWPSLWNHLQRQWAVWRGKRR